MGGFPLTPMVKSDKDVAGTSPAEDHAVDAASQVKKPDHGPVWDDKLDRVKVAVFRHAQKQGRFRYTTGINRSYKTEDGKWVNTSYFDDDELDDVIEAVKRAKIQIDKFKERDAAATEAA